MLDLEERKTFCYLFLYLKFVFNTATILIVCSCQLNAYILIEM